MSEIAWSEWLDYNQEQISNVPVDSGVYMMHASMKILYIGHTANLRQSILESLSDTCVKDAKRFKYSTTPEHEKIGMQLLKEYQEKHNGEMPKCMR